MSDSLRDRIIAALLSEDDIVKMADAVIAELGLKEQTRGPLTSYYDGRFHDDKTIYRHVTDWRTKK